MWKRVAPTADAAASWTRTEKPLHRGRGADRGSASALKLTPRRPGTPCARSPQGGPESEASGEVWLLSSVIGVGCAPRLCRAALRSRLDPRDGRPGDNRAGYRARQRPAPSRPQLRRRCKRAQGCAALGRTRAARAARRARLRQGVNERCRVLPEHEQRRDLLELHQRRCQLPGDGRVRERAVGRVDVDHRHHASPSVSAVILRRWSLNQLPCHACSNDPRARRRIAPSPSWIERRQHAMPRGQRPW